MVEPEGAKDTDVLPPSFYNWSGERALCTLKVPQIQICTVSVHCILEEGEESGLLNYSSESFCIYKSGY